MSWRPMRRACAHVETHFTKAIISICNFSTTHGKMLQTLDQIKRERRSIECNNASTAFASLFIPRSCRYNRSLIPSPLLVCVKVLILIFASPDLSVDGLEPKSHSDGASDTAGSKGHHCPKTSQIPRPVGLGPQVCCVHVC